ncbi:hypothetical protein C6N75_23615 [Streptomyces solincola]|uniref:Uncharacterized protein n=1 Tax=Streptomyces solincola TaxID=2100817 RepID=A0A2S9PQW5_9ACTN|nr:DUF6233 domain-containing protein [Streptomyces solincola]PRH76809.1 hypothetical protein C6N75_23615 [Streptomyces solincola]
MPPARDGSRRREDEVLAALPELPPDLERLRIIERWLVLYLDRVREAIAAHHTLKAAVPRPPAPEPGSGFRLERMRDTARTPVRVHLDDCRRPGRTTALTREEARRALMEVEECPYCRPKTELGML